MKKLAVVLSIAVLLAVLSSCFSSLAQPSHVPHQNPATVSESVDSALLLRLYNEIFGLTATRQYQDAQSLLTELEQAKMPDRIHDIITSYNRLSSQLFATINSLEALLDETSTLFAHNQMDEARRKLSEAETTSYSALVLLEDVARTANALGEELGVFTAAPSSPLKKAYDRQQEVLSQLRQLINELDRLRQSLGLNPLMEIETSFYYPTLLEVSAPWAAYLGRPITISGRVGSRGGTVDRTVKVFLDNTQLAEEIVQGEFSLEVTPPRQVLAGKHSLTLVVTPQGRYAGDIETLPIIISGVAIRTEIRVPALTVIPKTVQISGKVYQDLTPVEGARVSLDFRGSTTVVRTSTDGSFTTAIEVPFELSLVGPQGLTMIIEPVEPWYPSLEIERNIFTINPAHIGVILVAFVSLGLLVSGRFRTRLPRRREAMVIPQVELPELPAVAPPVPQYEFTGIKGRILSAYLSGLRAVEKVTGVAMAPNVTLREFLGFAAPQISAAVKPFTELTAIAESALYSAHRLDEDTAGRAELLATAVQKELRSELA